MSDRKLDNVLSDINAFMSVHRYRDYGPMGLQHRGNDIDIKGVASAVSVTEDVIYKAANQGANLLAVHHGLYWDNEPREIDERMQRRKKALYDTHMTLLSYHLALDAHPIIGNNVLIAKALGIKDPIRFADIGFAGEIDPKVSTDIVFRRIVDLFPGNVQYFPFGEWDIKSAAIVTGKGGSHIFDAKAEGYDLILTGEAEEPSRALAKELGIHFVAVGHYQSEKNGIDKLGEYIASIFNVPYQFILDDNPV